jgi:hypothetical protein
LDEKPHRDPVGFPFVGWASRAKETEIFRHAPSARKIVPYTEHYRMMHLRDRLQIFWTGRNLYRGFDFLPALMCQKEIDVTSENESNVTNHDRRKFLAAAGKFAIIVPPAMTLLLSTTMNSPSIAASGAPKAQK